MDFYKTLVINEVPWGTGGFRARMKNSEGL